MSLAIEPSYRYPPSGNGNGDGSGNGNEGGDNNGNQDEIFIPEDGHDNFIFGNLGYYHNFLMQEALEANINITIEENHINSETKTLLISHNYFSNPDILATFGNNEPLLIESLNYIKDNMADSMLNAEGFIQNLQASANVKTALQTIYNQIKQMDISNLTPFLFDTQKVILNSSLSDVEKNKLLIFIAVANSSGAFWNINF